MRVRCDDSVPHVWRIAFAPSGDGDITIDRGGLTELLQLLEKAEQDAACRVLVLEGSEQQFCVGMDLGGATDSVDTAQLGLTEYEDALSRLRHARQAVIALVSGEALAGGIGLAAASDLLMATEDARFGLPEIMLGLVPGMVLPTLLDRMPLQKVRRFALQLQSISAHEAQHLGLVDVVVPDRSALEKALRQELKSLLRCQPEAIGQLKASTSAMQGRSFGDAIKIGQEATAARLADPSTQEGIRSFLGGEPLPWLDRYRPKK